jgi:hypothetical protein
MRSAIADWPAVRFRLPVQAYEVERYDEVTGKFIPDDGEPGLAFSGKERDGFPMTYCAEVPYYDNVVKSWWTKDRTEPSGRLWHFETRDGRTEMGDYYPDRENHPNKVAYRAAADRTCEKWSCSNGRVVVDMAHSESGGDCAWCANNRLGHMQDKARQERSTLEGQVTIWESNLDEAREQVAYAEDMLQRYRAALAAKVSGE